MRRWLYATAAVMALAAGLFWLDRPAEEWPHQAPTARQLAQTLTVHPTDWRVASALSEHVIDEDSAKRIEAWRAAHDLAAALAPHMDAPRIAFARGGFFHWLELSDDDRKAVLDATQPLMRDPLFYSRMAHPIFELTGDLEWLRRSHPDDTSSLRDLRDLAAMYGRFQDYRELRAEEIARRTAEFSKNVGGLDPSQIIEQLPTEPRATDQPMLLAALKELHHRPLEVDPNRSETLDALIDYAVRHRLQPLDGLRGVLVQKGWASDAARAQLAGAMSPAPGETSTLASVPARKESVTARGVTWVGTCGTVVCRSAIADVSGPFSIEVEPARNDDVPPYVEVYVDDELAGELPIAGRTTVTTVPAGHHRVEIRLVNRLTRNRENRLIRIE